jgi:hypothetical protein
MPAQLIIVYTEEVVVPTRPNCSSVVSLGHEGILFFGIALPNSAIAGIWV